MEGLFPASDLVARRSAPSLVARCGLCKLSKGCKSPKMKPDGQGLGRILIVGEAPGEQEDEQGKPFVGRSGDLLQSVLAKCGLKDFRKECWFTNALICRPPNNVIQDNRAVDYCRPNLINTIERLKPEIIIPLGSTAVKSLIGWVWKEDPGSISRWVGWRIPCQKLNAWICPTYHPSYILRADERKGERKLLDLFWEDHLDRAVNLPGRPWDTVPEYNSKVELVHEPQKAADAVADFVVGGRAVSFDFETDRLKPDDLGATILCASVSDGERTISFPWQGPVIQAMKALITSDIPKVGWSSKFESRWCKRILGVWPKNWIWDGLLAAHLLDNRRHICSLKFQAFVSLGVDSYDDNIKVHMTSESSNLPNKLKQNVSLDKLLLYCGLDSLYEMLVGRQQMKQLRMEP